MAYSQITKFDLECDHDQMEIRKQTSNTLLWVGGCLREGEFVFQSAEPVIIRLTSDKSVSKTGFELQFDTSTQARASRVPPPGGSASVCSKRGRHQNNGSCACSSGFTGEGCSSRIICCKDPLKCHDAACDLDPRKLIIVAGELGDDTLGTGELMDASESGSATKAVQSLARALSLSSDGDTIFLYPGVYSGPDNRDLQVVAKKNLQIRTMKGSFWTKLDCELLGRAFDISASALLSVDGLTIQNCGAIEGGALRVVSSQVDLSDVVIISATATLNGGALYGSDSAISFTDSVVLKCSASSSGGGLYLVKSSLVLTHSNISSCTADDGGSMALLSSNTVTGKDANLTKNAAVTEGGAISVRDGDATLDGLSITLNNAGVGGALAVRSASLQVKNALIANNNAYSTGGGFAFFGSVDATIVASSILKNRAAALGGGIYFQGTGTLVLTGSPGKWALKSSTILH